MQITETFSLADLIAVISIAIVTVTSYCNTKQLPARPSTTFSCV